MANLKREHFDEALKKYANRDPELYKELREKIATPRTELVAHAMRHFGLALEEPLTIVRPNARPVLVIRDNRATLEAAGAPTARSGPHAFKRRRPTSTG